jgi:hypothetical protein
MFDSIHAGPCWIERRTRVFMLAPIGIGSVKRTVVVALAGDLSAGGEQKGK